MVTADTAHMLPFGHGRRRCSGEGLAMRLVALTVDTSSACAVCFEWNVGEGCYIDMTEGVGLSMLMAKSLESVSPGSSSDACSLLQHD